jgi:hypothetical protein
VQHFGKKDEIVRAAGHFVGQADQPGQGARCADQGHMAFAAKCIAAFQHNGNVECLVEDARERVGRIQAQRREHGHDLVLEISLQPTALLVGPLVAGKKVDALRRQCRKQFVVPGGKFLGDQVQCAFANTRQRFGRGHAVGARGCRAERMVVFEHRHAHLEELVHVVVHDGQVAQPFEQGYADVACLGQHAEIEFQRGQFAIEKQLGGSEVDHFAHEFNGPWANADVGATCVPRKAAAQQGVWNGLPSPGNAATSSARAVLPDVPDRADAHCRKCMKRSSPGPARYRSAGGHGAG